MKQLGMSILTGIINEMNQQTPGNIHRTCNQTGQTMFNGQTAKKNIGRSLQICSLDITATITAIANLSRNRKMADSAIIRPKIMSLTTCKGDTVLGWDW